MSLLLVLVWYAEGVCVIDHCLLQHNSIWLVLARGNSRRHPPDLNMSCI